jgi:2-desacetyl-2-hydroxyethyl bacteriochlorophyllide A dehydrogenase
MTHRNRRAVIFTGPGMVEIRQEALDPPGIGEVLVQTVRTAISAGTELLIYRGHAPAEMAADAALPGLQGDLAFPVRYGYAAVGRVVEVGDAVDRSWLGRAVFAFQPHQTHFVSPVSDLVPLPASLDLEEGVFIPNLETAVGLVHDGRPLAGERVIVIGQGIVGLLTTCLLARMPLARLVTLDRYPRRRQASLARGAHACLDPAESAIETNVRAALEAGEDPGGSDLSYELSGDPSALNLAIASTGPDGRIVIGSWYGRKTAPLDLGSRFHRNRLRLIGSQVSRLGPELTGRWTKARRLGYVLELLPGLRPSSFITHRVPFEQAPEAYRMLDRDATDALQVVLTYPET